MPKITVRLNNERFNKLGEIIDHYGVKGANISESLRNLIDFLGRQLNLPRDTFKCETMDWNLFYKLSRQVATKIINSEYEPDIIVGLARGGWVLARVLCDYLNVKDLVSLKVEHWGITATPDGKAKLKYPFKIDLTGNKILVVDDITDTGESMRIAVDYVNSLNPSEVKTATLRHIEGSKFVPDYYADEIKWRWVIFPWNFTEDMCNIIHKVLSQADTAIEVKQIRSKLKQNYEIDVTEETIKEILQRLERRGLLKYTK